MERGLNHPDPEREPGPGARGPLPGTRAGPGAPGPALLWLGVLGAFCALLPGCLAATPRRIRPSEDLLDPNPTRRLQAVSETSRLRDQAQIPLLIERLDDADEGVRLLAGTTLTDLTGRDTGYVAFAPPAERRRQVQEWRSWWSSPEGQARARSLSAPRSLR